MFWADELAAQLEGPQVVNDSKTPSGTVHVGSLRGVVLHDAIARAPSREHGLPSRVPLRRRRPGPHGLPGAPDAGRRRALHGRAAGARAGAGGQRRRELRPPLRGRAVHGHVRGARHPPDIYWMSELYGDGTMDRYIRTALDRAERIREHLPARQQRREGARLAARLGHLRAVRHGSAPPSPPTGTARPSPTPASPTTWSGPRAAATAGRVAPFGGRAKLPWNVDWAAKWSLFGVTVEGCGKDLATAGGVARPQRRHQPRGVRARAAAQRGLRVPQHRRPQDEHVEGQRAPRRTRWPSCCPPELLRFLFLRHKPRRAIEFDPEGDTIPGLFDEFDRIAAAIAGQPVRGELPPDPERIFRQSLVDPDADRRGRGRPLPARRSATSRCWCRCRAWTWRRAWPPRRARRSTTRSAPSSTERVRSRADVARIASRPTGTGSRSRTTLPAERRAGSPRRSASARRARGCRRGARRPAAGDAWQDLIFRTARPAACRRATRSRPLRRVPGPRQRPARRLAAGEPRAGVRVERLAAAASAVGRGAPRRTAEETRHERRAAAAARRRRDRPRRAPSTRARTRRSSTRRSRSTRGAATCWARRTRLRGRAQGASASRSAPRSRAAPRPSGPEVAELRARSTGARRAHRGAGCAPGRGRRRELDELLLRIPNPPDPDVPGGRRGGQRHRAHLGRAAAATPSRARRRRPGSASPTGRSPRRSASSTSRRAPRSPAPASRSTGAPARRSSARSSTSSSSSTRASTA